MIELQKVETPEDPTGFYGEVWTNEANTHVIAQEDGRWFVRDESGTLGDYPTFSSAFEFARLAWGEVTLAPASRLRETIEDGRADEVGHFLLEYLADHGAVGIDVQALARRVFERVGDDEEAWR